MGEDRLAATRCPLFVRVWVAGAAMWLAVPLSAHVNLVDPNGGETLTPGDTVVIEWVIAIQHNTLDWDLWYSTSGDGGPWIPIATDLPPGDTTSGSVHTFTWTVPQTPSDMVRVRVQQDNGGIDYEDTSDNDLSIVQGLPFVDGFESGDTAAWSATVP